MARRNTTYLLVLFVIFAFCLSQNGVYAFGAGNIPSFAYMEGRAFRHGDIEDILSEMIKKGSAAGGGFALGSLLGSKGTKFNGLDVKRVYFGNWLRDYSQAVDIASLKKVPLQTIINLCMVLGFLAHGYATHEFEVTPERLGVYLPTEHIDNPKGYGEGEDARQYHPNLRGPVDVSIHITLAYCDLRLLQPRELEIDPQTGMKNYIANEQGHWDTSKGLVRRTLERCIHHGRQNRANGQKQDEYEAFRLLGQSLHTLEDFSAHSNFCELALVSLGHQEVFVHVGDQVRIQAPNGKWVAPIVTGSFGSSDFIFSLLGEATDHLASVTDLNKELDKARSKSLSNTRGPGGPPINPADTLRDLLFAIPGGSGSDMSRDLDNIERIRAGPAAGGKNPDEMSPQELHSVLWQVLTFRDSVVKKISKTIEKIPGLGPLIEKITDSISVFPFMKPILKSATSGLSTVSGEVIDNVDQYEVFNDPRASDPTHSFLSKDHFNLILNEPAGQIAKIIVRHAVKLVTKAWDDTSVNVHQVTEDILQCLFHPDFHNSNSQIQREMMQYMKDWVSKLPNQRSAMQRLGKNAVRNHENIRLAGEGGPPAAQGTFAETEAHQFQSSLQGFASSHVPGFSQAQSFLGGAGQGREVPGGPGYPASYYGGGAPALPNASYGRPEGPPPGQSYGMPGGNSSFQPGYAPSYGAPPSQGGPPSFPGSAPGYGGGPERQPTFPGTGPGYPGEPERRPTFPGAAPGFPGDQGEGGGYGSGGYDNPPHGGHHGHGHGHGHHGHGHGGPPAFPGSEGPPGFPGAGGLGGFGGPPGPPGPGGAPYGFPQDPYGAPQFPGAPGGNNPPYGGGW
ncbi:hypothetical protein HYPSUDRAFT_66529 [Hypholoma sublateritium FD-334 SS-4]|uniref:Het-C-domain-containing protein n=1 Tax=Hypholoma sublateritium (strain FD-334 SS-4) TaxID=945553 RepID=A0A0D2NW69_HYPSF|nr:hypothetical protein HYPSUDRAFT_66529 [Hypholoma sublateritium FD-334 SS-4]